EGGGGEDKKRGQRGGGRGEEGSWSDPDKNPCLPQPLRPRGVRLFSIAEHKMPVFVARSPNGIANRPATQLSGLSIPIQPRDLADIILRLGIRWNAFVAPYRGRS